MHRARGLQHHPTEIHRLGVYFTEPYRRTCICIKSCSGSEGEEWWRGSNRVGDGVTYGQVQTWRRGHQASTPMVLSDMG